MTTLRGHWTEDPRKLRLMEWLTTPRGERVPGTQNDLAAELGVHPRSLRVWSARDDFRADWDREAKNIIGSPERAQHVLDNLYRAATDPTNRNQVSAAKLYLEATNSIKPPAIEVTVKRPPDLSDEELDALLAQGATALADERRLAQETEDAAVIVLHPEDGVTAVFDHGQPEAADASD